MGYNEGYLSLGLTLDFHNSTLLNDPLPKKTLVLKEPYHIVIDDLEETQSSHHFLSDTVNLMQNSMFEEARQRKKLVDYIRENKKATTE